MKKCDNYLIQDDTIRTPNQFKMEYEKEDEENIVKELHELGFDLDTKTKIATKFREY